jgi:hypothetical protein
VAVPLLLVAALVAGCSAAHGGRSAQPGQRNEEQIGPTVPVPDEIRGFRSTRRLHPAPLPRRLVVPELGIDTALELLDRRADGTVEVPRDWSRAGWYRRGPRPGEPGSAVILGHVDSREGPAVFSGLAGLARGALVLVDRADGSVVRFRVTRAELYPRARFPVEQVYLPTLGRELRLITCGGRYLPAAGGYQSNVVIFATAE